ncbi:MAG: DUF6325 family protein [Actinomycetota bacterium]
MGAGPVEIITIGFENGKFDGSILGELAKVVSDGTITLIDGLFVHKIGEHDFEIAELSEDPEVGALVGIAARVDGLLSDEDVDTVADQLPVGSAAAVLVFEHTWVIPLRDAIVGAGGELLDTVRIPGPVVDELLAELAELEEN